MRVFTTSLWQSALLAILFGTTGAGLARADEALRHVQQSLRDQGFYYGPIDGSPGDETTQALRRYQIRNGLTVSGQLTDETRRSIERTGGSADGSGNRSTAESQDASTPAPLSTPARRAAPIPHDPPPPVPAYRPPPQPQPQADSESQDYAPSAPSAHGNIRPDLRVRPDAPPPGGGPAEMPRDGIAPSVTLTALLASTPYEFAPPPVQADVLRRAQVLMTRNGFYDGRTDGVPGPATAEALTNFQEVNHLRRTGRLDVNTLGTMRLLPGRQTVGPRRDDDPRRGPNIIFPGRIVD